MKLREILTAILTVILAVSATIIVGSLLIQKYTSSELNVMNISFQIVVFILSASAGSIALLKYWNSIEFRNEQQKWEKLRHLEALFNNFRNRNLNIIQAFDYPHILRKEYLPLCTKAIEYDDVDYSQREKIFTNEEMKRLRELDDFLEYFENLYFGISRKLIQIEDIFVFLRYYIKLLCDEYYASDDDRLRFYISKYYYNLQELLKLFKKSENKYLGKLT